MSPRSVSRPPLFDELLDAALAASPAQLPAVLDGCPDPEIRAAVVALLEAEGDLPALRPPTLAGASLDPAAEGSEEAARRPTPPPDPGFSDPGLRRRLPRVARILALVATGFLGLVVVLHLVRGDPWTPALLLEIGSLVVLPVGFLGLDLAARSGRVGEERLALLAHGFGIGACALTGYFHAAHELHRFGRVTAFGPAVVFVALLPLVVRAPVDRTIRAAGAAAIAALAASLAALVPAAGRLSMVLPDVAMGLLVGVGIAAVVSRHQVGLQRQAAAGRLLGSYRLKEKLGEGGMGEVWRASHALLARPAALKLVRAAHLERTADREAILERFHREARITALLESTHTVRLFDFGTAPDGTVYLAMELLDGIDLRELVRRFGRQPADRVRRILSQMCDSLAEAHGRGLVHRDVKPANVMVCRLAGRFDVVKVLDFGIVGLAPQPDADGADAVHLTRTGALLGTPAFLAPEVLAQSGEADERSDLYSLGGVGYWLLTGGPVFDEGSPLGTIAAQLRDAPTPPSERGVPLSADLEAVVLACLDRDPRRRPASARDLARRLEDCRPSGDWDDERARAWWDEHLPARERDGEDDTAEHFRIRPGA